MALSESIKQIAIFDECIYYLFFFPPVHTNQPKAKMAFVCFTKQGEHAVRRAKRFQWSIILMQIMTVICALCHASDGFPHIRCTMRGNHSGLDLFWLKCGNLWLLLQGWRNYSYHLFHYLAIFCLLVFTSSKVAADCPRHTHFIQFLFKQGN